MTSVVSCKQPPLRVCFHLSRCFILRSIPGFLRHRVAASKLFSASLRIMSVEAYFPHHLEAYFLRHRVAAAKLLCILLSHFCTFSRYLIVSTCFDSDITCNSRWKLRSDNRMHFVQTSAAAENGMRTWWQWVELGKQVCLRHYFFPNALSCWNGVLTSTQTGLSSGQKVKAGPRHTTLV